MKKLTTQITKSNKTKTIFIMVDEKEAKFIEGLDEKLRHEYIVSEHEIYLNELKETRRHQSFELSVEGGYEFEDEESSVEEICLKNEKYSKLHKAISNLSEEQQWLIKEIYFKGRSQVEIARELCVDHTAIRNRLRKIFEKIKKFYI